MQTIKKILYIMFSVLLGQGHIQGTELPQQPSHCPSYEYIWENWHNLQEADSQIEWDGKKFQVLKVVRHGECTSRSITLKAFSYPLSPRYGEHFDNMCAYGLKCDEILKQVIVIGVPRNDG